MKAFQLAIVFFMERLRRRAVHALGQSETSSEEVSTHHFGVSTSRRFYFVKTLHSVKIIQSYSLFSVTAARTTIQQTGNLRINQSSLGNYSNTVGLRYLSADRDTRNFRTPRNSIRSSVKPNCGKGTRGLHMAISLKAAGDTHAPLGQMYVFSIHHFTALI